APAAGARCYLCVAGGIAVAGVMGSRSTDLAARFGGWHGRPLQSGDELPLGPAGGSPDELLRRRLVHPPPAHDPDRPIRVVLGPQDERFTAAGVTRFLDAAYVVSPRSDRMGLRLDGPPIAHAVGADLVSEGIAHGAVQVPGDGHPIVLLAARQTIGGYPKIATVAAADLDALGQRRPGDPVRFAAVGVREARALALAYHAGLGEDAVTASSRPGSGWVGTSSGTGGRDDDVANAWNPTAVARLVDALRAADVASFRIEVASAGLKLEVQWKISGGPSAAPGPTASEDEQSNPDNVNEDTVTAPLLGVFFRRPAPDQDAFTEEGRAVQKGQTIGLIEVMKTYHEVTAPKSGILAAFLVDDGATVEYGQPVARLRESQAVASS
ncbi:MAG: acetyl-CoA carboxylase, partial [Chloroflexota bacterium]|nr:acetyl-CoA carboxylase [Chloroflexota bacterium]